MNAIAIENTASLGSLVKQLFDYVSVKDFLESCENHCQKLINEVNQKNVTKAVDYCVNNTFCDDFLQLDRYFIGMSNSKELLNIVQNQEMTYEEVWEMSQKLENYIKDSKVAIVNKQMYNFVIANSFLVLYQAQNIVSIYSTIKEAGAKIDNEKLFDDIKDKISTMDKKLSEYRLANEEGDLRKILALKTILDNQINEAKKELAKIDKSLVDLESSLIYAKEQSAANGFSNIVNICSSVINIGAKFQSANMAYKVLSLVFGPVGFALLSIGNAKNYCDANRKLEDLKTKQRELNRITRDIDEIGNQMANILLIKL